MKYEICGVILIGYHPAQEEQKNVQFKFLPNTCKLSTKNVRLGEYGYR